ncbi:hypothetical protein [Streptomyces prasinus]
MVTTDRCTTLRALADDLLPRFRSCQDAQGVPDLLLLATAQAETAPA